MRNVKIINIAVVFMIGVSIAFSQLTYASEKLCLRVPIDTKRVSETLLELTGSSGPEISSQASGETDQLLIKLQDPLRSLTERQKIAVTILNKYREQLFGYYLQNIPDTPRLEQVRTAIDALMGEHWTKWQIAMLTIASGLHVDTNQQSIDILHNPLPDPGVNKDILEELLCDIAVGSHMSGISIDLVKDVASSRQLLPVLWEIVQDESPGLQGVIVLLTVYSDKIFVLDDVSPISKLFVKQGAFVMIKALAPEQTNEAFIALLKSSLKLWETTNVDPEVRLGYPYQLEAISNLLIRYEELWTSVQAKVEEGLSPKSKGLLEEAKRLLKIQQEKIDVDRRKESERLLTGRGMEPAKALRREVSLADPQGMHARAAIRIAKAAKRFPKVKAWLSMRKRIEVVEASSIVELLMLRADTGDKIEIITQGVQEVGAALNEIAAAIAFVPKEEAPAEGDQVPPNQRETAGREGTLIKGMAASPGVTEGKVRFVEHLKDVPAKDEPPYILMCQDADKEPVAIFLRALDRGNIMGLITVFGGKTTHLASVVRDANLPYVSGIDHDEKGVALLKKGAQVRLNGDTGEIEIFGLLKKVKRLFRPERQSI